MARAKVSMRYNRVTPPSRPAPSRPTSPPVKPTVPPPAAAKPSPTPAPTPVTTPTPAGKPVAKVDPPPSSSPGSSSKLNLYIDEHPLKGGPGGNQTNLDFQEAFGQQWGNYNWSAFNPSDFGFSMEDVPDYMRSLAPKALVMMMMKKGLLKGKKKKKKKLKQYVDSKRK